jgi:sulfopyruvate decarboxylase TPP-binding subunit
MNNFFVGVPFSGCEKLIGNDSIVAAREDEAIGIAVGAWFAGKTPTVYMQNSGLGNCFDILTSLLKPYEIEIDLLINNRIEPEHHKWMGLSIHQLLAAIRYEKIRLC